MNSLKFNIFEYGKPWGCFCILLILNAFYSLHAYPFWHLNTKTLDLVFGALTLTFVLANKYWFQISSKSVIIIFFFLAAFFIRIPIGNLNRYLLPLLRSTPLYILFFLKDGYKSSLLTYFSKILAIIVAISSIGWILFLLNIPLPSVFDYYGEAHEGSDQEFQYIYYNHYLYLENIGIHIDVMRFSCIFLEPGYFSILLVFLLYIGHFNFSTIENKIYLIALLFTLSLAGYLMLFGSFICHTYSMGNKKRFWKLLSFFLIVLVAIQFFSMYEDGHNIVNEKFLSRLEWDSERNNFSGYNRTNEDTDNEFIEVLTGPDILLGRGEVENGIYSVGYKPYIIMYGLVGLYLLLMALYLVYKKNKCYESLILFVIFVVMFARGHHTAFYQGFWLVYVCGCSKMLLEQRVLTSKRQNNITK